MITDRNGRTKRAELVDYINEIKYIERPHWFDEATKAHEIRKREIWFMQSLVSTLMR